MTTIASLRILLGLDSGGVKSGANSVRNDLKGVQAQANVTNATLMQIGKGLQAGLGLGAGLGAFQLVSQGVRELTGFLGDGVKAAQDDEASIARLGQALQANVKDWDGRTDAVDAAIKTGQRLGFTDDEIRNSVVRLSAATHDLNESLRVTAVAQDLARFKEISLAEATSALTKIEAGRFRGLADLGIVLKAGATQVEAIAAVEAVAAGQAKIFGETSAGAGEEAAVAMGEAGEAIGRSLLPALKEIAHFARDVVAPALTAVGDNMGTIIAIAEVLGAALVVKVAGGFAASAVAAVAASATQVGAIGAVTVAFDAMKISAIAAWLASLGPAALLAGAGVAFIKLIEATQQTNASQREAAISAGDLAGAQAKLKAEAEAGTIGWDQYDTKLDEVIRQQELQARMAVLAAGGTNEAADAAAKAAVANDRGAAAAQLAALATKKVGDASAAAADEMAAATVASSDVTAAHLRVAQATLDASAAHADLANAQKVAAAAAVGDTAAIVALAVAQVADTRATAELKAAQDALAASAVAVKAAMLGAGNGTDDLSDALLRSANAAAIAAAGYSNAADQADRLKATGGAPFVPSPIKIPGLEAGEGQQAGGGTTLAESFLEGLALANQNAAALAARAAARLAELKRLQDEASASAKRNAGEIAAAYRDRLGDAFDAVKRQAHQFFDDLHKRNLDAIADAHRMADEQIAAQKRANLEAVTAAEAAFKAVQDQRQLASLQANVAAAEDPTAKIAAQQALNDFLTRQRIDAMRATATAANDQLDTQKAANDKLAADAITAENDRNAAQVAAFDFDLAALQKGLAEHPKAWASTQQDVLKLLMRFGVDYKKAGASLGKQFADGLLLSSRLAEEAAAALAVAARGSLGVVPAVPGGTTAGGSAGASVAAGITPTQPIVQVFVYIGEDDISDRVDVRQAVSNSRATSGGIAG